MQTYCNIIVNTFLQYLCTIDNILIIADYEKKRKVFMLPTIKKKTYMKFLNVLRVHCDTFIKYFKTLYTQKQLNFTSKR